LLIIHVLYGSHTPEGFASVYGLSWRGESIRLLRQVL